MKRISNGTIRRAQARAGAFGSGIVEQILFSAGTFLGLLLFARDLDVRTFGYLTATQGIVLLAATAQGALITEPAVVLVSGSRRSSSRSFIARVLVWHACLVVALGLVAGVAVLLLVPRAGFGEFAAVLAFAALLPTNLLLRRLAYALPVRPIALVGSSVYSFTLISLASTATGDSSLGAAVGRFAVAAGLSATVLGFLVALALSRQERQARGGPVIADLWRLGKWSLLGTPIFYVSSGLIPVVLAAAANPQASAAWGAAYNLTTPITQLSAAIGLVLLPRMAGRFYDDEGGPRIETRAVARTSGFVFLTAAAFASPLLLMPATLLDFAYEGSYGASATLLVILTMAALVDVYKQCFTTALVAGHQARRVVYARAIGVVVLAASSITATAFLTLTLSVALGLVLSNVAIVAVVRRGLR